LSVPAPLTLDVYVAPMRPFSGAASSAPGDEPMWSPLSSTLIAGQHDAILVDTLVTFDQVDELASWIKSFNKRLTSVYITHGHADHWIGLARLLEHFPHALGLATADVHERAAFEATDPATSGYWNTIFAGELPTPPVLPTVMDTDTIELEGNDLQVIHVGQGDTEHSTVLYVPSIAAVVAGDVVYNGVHIMTAETNAAGRDRWIASLDQVAALQPKTVVAGHKRVDAPDSPHTIAATQSYLRDFTRIAAEKDTAEAVVAEMLALHGDRDNPRVLWHSARAAVSMR
jgi:glyoxylase-like metal-dependent hydrolase (beta-lactamase superfamily II)